MGRTDRVGVVQLLSIEGETEGSLDTGAESLSVAEANDTSVIDLGLDEGSSVKVDLGADLEGDTAVGGLGVVDGLGTSLDVAVDALVVGGGEGLEVVETVDGNGVLRSVEADGGRVAGDLALGDVVGGLSADEETVTAEDSVGSEGRTL